MRTTPNTVGMILLFLAVFLGCILWATRGMYTEWKLQHRHHEESPGYGPGI